MKNKFYLRAYGDEINIRLFHKNLRMDEAIIKPLRNDEGWHWYLPYNDCSSLFPEDELEKFLLDNPDLIDDIRKYRHLLAGLMAIIVCEINEFENPKGYSISPNLMKALSEIGAFLEIDIINKLTS